MNWCICIQCINCEKKLERPATLVAAENIQPKFAPTLEVLDPAEQLVPDLTVADLISVGTARTQNSVNAAGSGNKPHEALSQVLNGETEEKTLEYHPDSGTWQVNPVLELLWHRYCKLCRTCAGGNPNRSGLPLPSYLHL